MTHTPGPWTTKPGLFFICHIGNNLDDPGVWSEAIPKDGSPFPFGDKEDDARLIAAAPDLLHALKVAIKRADDNFATGDYSFRTDECKADYDLCKAAIAKATGEEST